MTNETWVLKLEADDPKFRIEGESSTSLYSRWINVERIMMTVQSPTAVANGSGSGKRTYDPIRITSNDQTALRGILFAEQQASYFKKATLVMIRDDKRSNSKPSLQIDLARVGIDSVSYALKMTPKDDESEYDFSLSYATMAVQGETRKAYSDEWVVSR